VLRFVHIDRSCKINGCTTLSLLLAEALVARGHEYAYAARGGPLSGAFVSAGARRVRTLCSPINRWQIARHLRDRDYDVLLCSGRGQTDTALDLARVAGRPSICLLHDPLRPRDTLGRMLRPDALVTFERPIHSDLLALGVPPERITLLPRPVRSRPLGPPAHDAFAIACVGRLSANKWPTARCILSSAPRLARAIGNLRMDFVGTGIMRRAAAALACEANRACGTQVVRIVGQTTDPLAWMERAHVVVAGGYTCLEAIYNCRRCIAAGYGWFGAVTPANLREALDCHFGDRCETPCSSERFEDTVLGIYRASGRGEGDHGALALREALPDDHSPQACAAAIEALASRLVAG
jgi:hypothetical protein